MSTVYGSRGAREMLETRIVYGYQNFRDNQYRAEHRAALDRTEHISPPSLSLLITVSE